MKKVFVGISGGVDSSVSAALLKDQGYDVTGVFMKNWTRDIGGVECPWRQDLADAQSVAAHLDIPFEMFDFEEEYKHKVVDYMVNEYKSGRTPNPDIVCNQEIKFKLFLDTALERGADLIATGHYARTRDGQLFAGVDKGKDQSYFLYRLTQQALEQTIFPLGDKEKDETRELAEKFGLPTSAKPDSMGICFVGEVDIRDFLKEYIDTQPGPIKHVKTGKILGEHEGAELYTIGQRHGLDIGGAVRSSAHGGLPLYVVSKDMESNTVYVTEDLTSLMSEEIALGDLHWINQPPKEGEDYLLRIRHLGRLVPAKVTDIKNDKAVVTPEEPQRAVTAGQSGVLYEQSEHGLRVIGGGTITQ